MNRESSTLPLVLTGSRATPAVLVLESGRVFRGTALGAEGEVFGEAVFNTSMAGYQEIVSDPSYLGQIVVMTAPQIGNTGVNGDDDESDRPFCAGLAIREASPVASNWRSQGSLQGYLRERGIVGIAGIDTRALTRALRQGGAQRSAIATGLASDAEIADLLERVRSSPSMEGRDLASAATCETAHTSSPPRSRWPAPAPAPQRFHVAAYDFGIKRGILRDLAAAGCRVTVLPAATPADEALALDADGYFLSNGPGDPAPLDYAIDAVRRLVDSGKPLFGICLGHQILALALGATTYKLPFGHHGGNHPVLELATGKVAITAQNHGFAVAEESLPAGVGCTHKSLYDQTVEGLELVDRPVFSVQYHPEACPGPHDAAPLFARFVESLENG